MKKILSCLAITLIFCACNKTDLLNPFDQEINPEVTFRAKKGGGGGPGMTVTTDEASYILPLGAVSGGSISSSGGGNSVTVKGICFSTSTDPTTDDETVPSGSGSGTFTSNLFGLDSGTTYYTRAYAIKIKNNGDTTITYGNEVSFETSDPNYGTVDDIDGNTYSTLEIGTQVWMMENLKTTKYRDGTLITNVTDDAEWADLSTGAYCNYGNNEANVANYGRLYNWFAVDDAHNIALEGWHVATTDEWETLVDYVGGGALYFAGGKLKEAGFVHWNPPYVDGNEGNNSSGFTAFGGGARTVYSSESQFGNMKRRGNWWTATGDEGIGANFVYMQSVSTAIMGSGFGGQGSDNYDKRCGYSVRLVKD